MDAGTDVEAVAGQPRQPTIGTGRRRRRPSGEPPPLPHGLGRSGRFWLSMVAYFLLTLLGVVLFSPFERFFAGVDGVTLRAFARMRVSPSIGLARVVNALAAPTAIVVMRWLTLGTLIVVRRWRHLLVYVGGLIVLEITAYQMVLFIARPRPFGVTTLAWWSGFSMPSVPMAELAITLVGVLYALLPHGRLRDTGKWIVGITLGAVMLSRLLLGVDDPSSTVFGCVLGIAVGLTAFRAFAPNEVFPVTYRRGKSAHLDVGGQRGEAIVLATADQLGEKVVGIKPVGLEGSGGSTPLRLAIETAEGEPRYVFAKLYAMSHVRADRWYKLGRTILYGALEDETPFGTVRRFVEYEDYALRLLDDLDFSTPEPYGVIEITPEREYMIAMEFCDDAVEISEAVVTPGIVDQGLELVQRMWGAGLAHRDIKPANLMVQGDRLRLIDVFFVQVRPSPWRQAVDLANMMLVLALRTDAPTVYEHALRYFTPDEIAEAFAAARGVASPTQLRTMLKQDERDLVAEFRALAPHRDPVRIQRWSVRRVALTAWVVLLGLFATSIIVSNWRVFA